MGQVKKTADPEFDGALAQYNELCQLVQNCVNELQLYEKHMKGFIKAGHDSMKSFTEALPNEPSDTSHEFNAIASEVMWEHEAFAGGKTEEAIAKLHSTWVSLKELLVSFKGPVQSAIKKREVKLQKMDSMQSKVNAAQEKAEKLKTAGKSEPSGDPEKRRKLEQDLSEAKMAYEQENRAAISELQDVWSKRSEPIRQNRKQRKREKERGRGREKQRQRQR